MDILVKNFVVIDYDNIDDDHHHHYNDIFKERERDASIKLVSVKQYVNSY
jgi:hypothetical protein